MSAVQQDETEAIRRHAVQVINSEAGERAELEKRYGQVWNTSELQADFDVRGFMAPFVVVRRKSDGAKGTLTFQHSPRFYFEFSPE